MVGLQAHLEHPPCGSESWTNRMSAYEFQRGIGNRRGPKVGPTCAPLWLLLRQRYARAALLSPRKKADFQAHLEHPLAGQKVRPVT